MGIYNRIAGIEKPRLAVAYLISDAFMQAEGVITWDQLKQRNGLSDDEFAELKTWWQALMVLCGNDREKARSVVNEIMAAVERGDFTEATYDEQGVELTPRIYHRITEAQVLTLLGL